MSPSFLARIMITAVAAGQGITPLFVDLNRTHATNPLWTGHARFHVVDQTVVMALLAIVEVALLWWIDPGTRFTFYLAALLTVAPIAGFLIATFTRELYGGTLRDANGVPALHLRIGGQIREIDVNLVLVAIGAVVSSSAIAIF
jgi:hypothetical protein